MAIEINGKIYRNIQEQVGKNKEDIEALQEKMATVYSTKIVEELPEVGEVDTIYIYWYEDNPYQLVWNPESEEYIVVAGITDTSNLVTLDTEQSITAKKTFTADQDLGDNTMAESPKLGFISTDASNQGNWYLYVNQNQNNFNICQLNGNNYVGIKMTRSGIYPTNTNYTALGAGSMRFKELYLRQADSNNTYGIDFGNNAKIYEDTSNRLNFTFNGNTVLKIGAVGGQSYLKSSLSPDQDSDNIDLGRSTQRWNNVYVKGNISDGTNSVKVSDIATKANPSEPILIGQFDSIGEVTFPMADLEDGVYMFTYAYAQAILYISSSQITTASSYGCPVRASMPVVYNGYPNWYAVAGNIRVRKSGTNYIFKVSDGNLNAYETAELYAIKINIV